MPIMLNPNEKRLAAMESANRSLQTAYENLNAAARELHFMQDLAGSSHHLACLTGVIQDHLDAAIWSTRRAIAKDAETL